MFLNLVYKTFHHFYPSSPLKKINHFLLHIICSSKKNYLKFYTMLFPASLSLLYHSFPSLPHCLSPPWNPPSYWMRCLGSSTSYHSASLCRPVNIVLSLACFSLILDCKDSESRNYVLSLPPRQLAVYVLWE